MTGFCIGAVVIVQQELKKSVFGRLQHVKRKRAKGSLKKWYSHTQSTRILRTEPGSLGHLEK